MEGARRCADDLKGDNIISVSKPFTDGKLKAYEKVVKSKDSGSFTSISMIYAVREYQARFRQDWYD